MGELGSPDSALAQNELLMKFDEYSMQQSLYLQVRALVDLEFKRMGVGGHFSQNIIKEKVVHIFFRNPFFVK